MLRRMYGLVARLRDKGVPIDGVGFQMRLSAMTVSTNRPGGDAERNLDVRAELYRAIFRVLAESGAGNSLMRCIFSDALAPTDEFDVLNPQPAHFDWTHKPKPACFARREELAQLPGKE